MDVAAETNDKLITCQNLTVKVKNKVVFV